MKKTKNKFLYTIVTILVLLLAACSGNSKGNKDINGNNCGDKTGGDKGSVNLRVVTTMATEEYITDVERVAEIDSKTGNFQW